MRIVVWPKNLELGGSQESAVTLAEGLTRLGEDVVVAAPSGPLEHRLRLGPTRTVRMRSGRSRTGRVAARTRLIRSERPDVVVAFEYPGILEAAAASVLAGRRTPVAGVIHATRVPWFLPESTSLAVARDELRRFTVQWWPGTVHLVPPPIPAPPQGEAIGRAPTVDGAHLLVVSRLVESFKAEGIVRSIEAMRHLARTGAVLTIAGDGPARDRFELVADRVNADVGRSVVRFAGAVTDPTAAIRSADVVLGSGMSIIHGLALERPCLVVGRDGFAAAVDAASLDGLRDAGFYGAGGPVLTPEALALRVIDVLDAHHAAAASELRERVLAEYGSHAVAAGFRSQLRSAAGGAAPTAGELVRAGARRWHYRWRRAGFRRRVPTDRITPEQIDDHVFGRLRDMPVAGRRLTGRRAAPARVDVGDGTSADRPAPVSTVLP
ncbi:MAG: glycosyltransferase [Actinomycetota bacterium]